jgi:Flp pilus assembly protein CpaB
MLATRRGAIALALTCAVAAAAVLVFAMGQYRHSLTTTSKQDTVLVATSEILKGASADAIATKGLYKSTPVLQSQVSPGAIVNAGSLIGKVAANNILPGEQLTAADFTTGATGLVAVLSPTERAVSVSLDNSHGLGGVLLPGDHVDVYGSFATKAGVQMVSLLVPNALVLRAPALTVAGVTGSSSGSGSVLLGISELLSPRIMYIFDNGKIWLELRGTDAVNPPPTITTLTQILAGNAFATATTYPAKPAGGTH